MSQPTLHLEILSPEGQIFSDDVNEVTIPTTQGEISILPNHAPLFTKLTEGETIIKKQNKDIFVALTGGFLEVSKNKVTILADYAVRSEKIEREAVERAKKKAEQLLLQKEKMSKVDFATAEKDLKRAILELHISEKVKKRYRPSS